MALKYFTRARDIGRHATFGPYVQDVNVAHAMEAVAWDALEKKNLEKAVTYMEKAAAEWLRLTPKYPHLPIIRSQYQEARRAAEWLPDENVPHILNLYDATREAYGEQDYDKAIAFMEEAARGWEELASKYPHVEDLRRRHQRALDLIGILREVQEKFAP
jgi:tetratricopeptide (TPR) repeat protein